MTNVNSKAIVEIAERSKTAEAFLNYASTRERNVRGGITKLPAIRAQMHKEGLVAVPQDLLSMFRELERAGIGKLMGDKFQWYVSIRKVGEALEGKPIKEPSPIQAATKSIVIYYGPNKEFKAEFTSNLGKEDLAFAMQKILWEMEK
jgi:hypothetical protein